MHDNGHGVRDGNQIDHLWRQIVRAAVVADENRRSTVTGKMDAAGNRRENATAPVADVIGVCAGLGDEWSTRQLQDGRACRFFANLC